jgi:hypothetical protein
MQTEDEFLEEQLVLLFKAYDEFALGDDFRAGKTAYEKRKTK